MLRGRQHHRDHQHPIKAAQTLQHPKRPRRPIQKHRRFLRPEHPNRDHEGQKALLALHALPLALPRPGHRNQAGRHALQLLLPGRASPRELREVHREIRVLREEQPDERVQSAPLPEQQLHRVQGPPIREHPHAGVHERPKADVGHREGHANEPVPALLQGRRQRDLRPD